MWVLSLTQGASGKQTCEIGMDASLHADLRGSPIPGFSSPPFHLLQVYEVWGPPQVLRQLPLGEGTEATAVGADICQTTPFTARDCCKLTQVLHVW